MPHAVIEFSANLAEVMQATKATAAVHQAMMASGLFAVPADIKTRAYAAQDFLVGELGQQGCFVHVTISLLEGRTIAQKQALTDLVRDALQQLLPTVEQLSVDIRDMTKDTYRKAVRG
jgi:5-carboxymethyl-2-hydroxymuconate isomerase